MWTWVELSHMLGTEGFMDSKAKFQTERTVPRQYLFLYFLAPGSSWDTGNSGTQLWKAESLRFSSCIQTYVLLLHPRHTRWPALSHKPALQKSPGHSRGDRTYPPGTLLELKNWFLFLLFTAEIELCGLLRCPLTPNLLVGSSFCSKFLHESVPSPASQEICRLKRQN